MFDGSAILKPALARGTLRCLGCSSPDKFKKTIEKDPALERRFQLVCAAWRASASHAVLLGLAAVGARVLSTGASRLHVPLQRTLSSCQHAIVHSRTHARRRALPTRLSLSLTHTRTRSHSLTHPHRCPWSRHPSRLPPPSCAACARATSATTASPSARPRCWRRRRCRRATSAAATCPTRPSTAWTRRRRRWGSCCGLCCVVLRRLWAVLFWGL